MNSIKLFYRKIIFLSLICGITFSCQKFDDINTNNYAPVPNSPGKFLESSIFSSLNAHLDVQVFLTNQVMQYYVLVKDNELDYYDFNAKPINYRNLWTSVYKTLRDNNDMIKIATAQNLPEYIAAGKILHAFYLATLTEMWINVPNKEAALGDENIQPKYDNQEEIYKQILSDLEDANKNLISNKSNRFTYGGDILYKGNETKWKKFANSLRLRYLLRLSNKTEINAPTEIKKIVNDPTTYPIFTSNSDAAIYDFTGITPITSNFSNIAGATINGFRISTRFVELLDGVDAENENDDDPRLSFFGRKPLDQTIKKYVGTQNGLPRDQYQSAAKGDPEKVNSYFTDRFQNNKSLLDFVFMSYSELQFILSEVALNGWIGTSADAKVYYEKGIEENLKYWGLVMPNKFLERQDIAWDGTKEKLIDQKWISMLFNNSIEMWGDKKRIDLPKFIIGSAAATYSSGKFPTRVFYPSIEQSVNANNYKQASDKIGGDIITAKHWYQ